MWSPTALVAALPAQWAPTLTTPRTAIGLARVAPIFLAENSHASCVRPRRPPWPAAARPRGAIAGVLDSGRILRPARPVGPCRNTCVSYGNQACTNLRWPLKSQNNAKPTRAQIRVPRRLARPFRGSSAPCSASRIPSAALRRWRVLDPCARCSRPLHGRQGSMWTGSIGTAKIQSGEDGNAA